MVAACGLPVIAIFLVFFLRRVSPLFTVIQHRLDQINCIVQENIAGARVVKAYVKEADALENFSKANDSLCAINLRAQTSLAFLNPCVNVVLNLCTVGVLYVGGISVQAGGAITPGQVMAAITYLSLILMRIIFMANIFQTFTRLPPPGSASGKCWIPSRPNNRVPPCRRQIERGKLNFPTYPLLIRGLRKIWYCGIYPSG